jgi:zinc/manganese transport system substrate-binding protein
MNNKVFRIISGMVFILLVLAIVIIPIVKRPKAADSSASIKVVAAENFWGNIAQQIGGNTVHVTSIITDPSADPHLYESSAANASAIASANVVITNGLGYDDFMSKLLGTSHAPNRNVLVAAHILGINGDSVNPHLWYDIPRVHEVADTISKAFIAADPAHNDIYKHNVKAFDDSLKPLMATLASIKQKYAGSSVAYTERVAGYVLSSAGLKVSTPPGFSQALEDGSDPSPSDTQAMKDLITSGSIKVLLYNSQASSSVAQGVKSLAQQYNIPVVGVTETLPAGEHTYQSWQQDQLNALQKALSDKQ